MTGGHGLETVKTTVFEHVADLRLATYGGMDPAHKIEEGGRGFAEEEVRKRHFAVLRELAVL